MTTLRKPPSTFLVCLFLLSLAISSPAKEIENVQFTDVYKIRGKRIRLVNVGLMRYRIVIKAMVAGLYVDDQVAPSRVLEDVHKRLEIEYFWSLKANDIVKASNQLLARNVAPAKLKALQPKIQQMSSLFEDVRPGDRYALTYVPGYGTSLSLNGKFKGLVRGADFAAAYFTIWLGQYPMDASLKKQLLR